MTCFSEVLCAYFSYLLAGSTFREAGHDSLYGLGRSLQAWSQASLVRVRNLLLYCPLPEAGEGRGPPRAAWTWCSSGSVTTAAMTDFCRSRQS